MRCSALRAPCGDAHSYVRARDDALMTVGGFSSGKGLPRGTSLIALLPTAAIGTLTHHRNGNVDVRRRGACRPCRICARPVAADEDAGRDLRRLLADRGDADVAV